MDSIIDRLYIKLKKENTKRSDIEEKIYHSIKHCVDDYVTMSYITERLDKIHSYVNQLNVLKTIPKLIQRTHEWHKTRETLITASDIGQAINKGKFGSQKDFLIKKIDTVHGCVPDSQKFISNQAVIWGTMFEEAALKIYSKRNGCVIYDFGLLRHPYKPYLGASPDGITDIGIMLEIKCPFRREITGEIPEQYYLQIQGQLEVADLEECDYIECKFEEYTNEDDFKRDVYTLDGKYNCILTADRMDRGIIIDVNNSYQYTGIGWNTQQMLKWKNQIISDIPFGKEYRIHFWRLSKYHVKRVYRDRELWNDVESNLRYIWNRVEFYKNNKSDYIADIVKSRKKTIFDFSHVLNTDECLIRD